MARMVTRTVVYDNITCLVYDTDTKETREVTVQAAHKATRTDTNMKNTFAKLAPANLKPIEVVSCTQDEQLYGMTVEDFMANAHPVTRGTASLDEGGEN